MCEQFSLPGVNTTMHRAKEIGDLAKAERRIAEGEAGIRRQAALVEKLRRNGQDTTEADRTLVAMQGAVDVWGEHRRHVLSALRETD
jgi:hypothetical protein